MESPALSAKGMCVHNHRNTVPHPIWTIVWIQNWGPRYKAKVDEISGKMREITKNDIALNNVVIRAKCFWHA